MKHVYVIVGKARSLVPQSNGRYVLMFKNIDGYVITMTPYPGYAEQFETYTEALNNCDYSEEPLACELDGSHLLIPKRLRKHLLVTQQ